MSRSELGQGLGRCLVSSEAWRYFAEFYRRRMPRLLLYGCVAALQTILVVPVLMLLKTAFDEAIPQQNVQLLVVIGAAVLSIRWVQVAVNLGLRVGILKVIKDATLALREDILGRLYSFSREHYTLLDVNTTHARIIQDTERLDAVCNNVASKLLPAVFTSVPLLVVLCVMSWRLLLVASHDSEVVAHSRSTYEIRDGTLHKVSSPSAQSATG